MTDEPKRRRRGHRRGPRPSHPGRTPQQPPEDQRQEDLHVQEESEAPGVLPSRLTFWRRRPRDRARKPPERERPGAPSAPTPDVSPLSFWRRGQARPYREQPLPRAGPARLWRRLTGFYFPPWVPVVVVILIVFGILGLLFVTRAATGAPRIGKDHWHATYQIFVCGERQPNAPTWEAGVHTHADGVIHIHPFVPSEEGSGARLVKWFEYGGGRLTQSEMRIPGSRTVYKNGDKCDDGKEATLQVSLNGERLNNWTRLIPHDGDRIRIDFGPVEAAPVTQEDRTIIPADQATRTLDLEVSDDGTEPGTSFSPAAIEVSAGETVKLAVKNTGTFSHAVRVAGADGQYDTSDDYVSDPEFIEPGAEGAVIIRFDTPGQVEFKEPGVAAATGTITVKEAAPTAVPSPTATGTAEAVDRTLTVGMGDNFFDHTQLEVGAGQRFRIDLTNNGPQFVHSLRIAGPDGQFDTDDDLVSEPLSQKPGDPGGLTGQIDTPGVYPFRCDFHPSEMTGTLTVQ